VFQEEHDRVRARIAVRAPGKGWMQLSLEHGEDCDRIGRWSVRVEPWPDHFETWRANLHERLNAGQELGGELLEGAALLQRIGENQTGLPRDELWAAAEKLSAQARSVAERVALALGDCVARFAAGYELFARSQSAVPGRHGRFGDVERRLPAIAELGLDVVYLGPIHPIGRTHRKGPGNRLSAGPLDPGSPGAIRAGEGGHTAVHPELGSQQDFDRLAARARELGMELALDHAPQGSPDHPWVGEQTGSRCARTARSAVRRIRPGARRTSIRAASASPSGSG
jgi:starch synthase (maltosyl-transferring)